MAISVDEALSSYGYVYDIANAIPQLRGFLQQAIQGGWAQDKLISTVESSPWWQQHSDAVRNLAILKATQPATYQANLDQAKGLIRLKAQQLGRTFTDAQLSSLALNQLTTNSSWDDQVLSAAVTNTFRGLAQNADGGALMGNAAQLSGQMKQVAQSYGIPYTDSWLNGWIADIQSGRNSLDGFEAVAKARAKATYPQFADELDAGQTVRDIADPYISTMAKTLEVPETSITVGDTYIQKALSQRNPDGTASSQPLWKFTQDLKNDPRYDHTTQAKTDAYSTLATIGKNFGFVGANQ